MMKIRGQIAFKANKSTAYKTYPWLKKRSKYYLQYLIISEASTNYNVIYCQYNESIFYFPNDYLSV